MLAALNKHYRAVSYDEYMDKWDFPTTCNAVAIAGFSKEIESWIWEPEALTLF